MGSAQSEITKQTLADYNSFMNTALQSDINTAISGCAAANNLSLQTGGEKYCDFEMINGSINVNQKVNATCSLHSKNINSITTKFNTTVKNTTQQFIDQNAKNKQGWFATAFSFQIQGASTSAEVSNKITNSFTGNISNTCRQEATAMNSNKTLLCGTYNASVVNINQDATITALTSCINRNVTEAFLTNNALNEMYQKTNQKLTSEQAGVGSFVFWIALAIVAGIILVIILGAVGSSGGSKGGDSGNVEIKHVKSASGKKSVSGK